MRHLLVILISATAFFSSCSKETVRGGGAIRTETRSLPAFTNIELGGSGDATINYGVASNVTVTGYENLLPIYETKVIGSTLYLQYKPDVYNVKNDNVKVSVTLPALAGLRVNGAGKIAAKNFVNTNLTASINGSGYIFIGDSQYGTAKYDINGSGEIKAATTIALDAEAYISGSGNINLNVSNKLKASISGSGNINYWGNPATTDTQVTGSGKINKK